MLTLTNLAKHFGTLRAVDGVSLNVPQGQIIGLIGPNGSGKSTLLSVIAGSQPPTSGQINFNGGDITGAPPAEIFRRGLARSYQDPALFTRMSVLDNALLPVRDQRGEQPLIAPRHRLWRAQENAHAQRAATVLEQLRLREQVTTAASDLSGGQMKLLELGRTLMGAPKLMLLDEPTAGVAPALAYTIFAEIARLRREQGITFLIVEHRLEMLFNFVDSLYVLHLGKVIAQGTAQEIQQHTLVREVYFGD